ncbi:MAG: hypothetical protein GF317_17130 [Candidatus Lokiarchaeota archaeon]|nr:hypothetical protein [Candidatus Lokiarchaeota archaeon]MBD3201236.1 hypothetical protein [Candidatus Lokiarchaeota archaeon]
MSGIEEDLLGPTISKKRVASIIIIAVLLLAVFAYSVVFFNWLLGSARLNPNERLDGAPEEDALLTEPPIPWNMSDLLDAFQDMDINLTDDMLDDLADLADGNIDDLDLSQFADLSAALLFSDIEVFRIYDYDSLSSLQSNLWKYEVYDDYLSTEWQCSVPLNDFEFYSYTDYFNLHSSQDLLTIAMELSPDIGINSFMIPNLFPNPYIMDGSINVPNINPSGTILKKNSFNSTTLTLDFTSGEEVNMSYQLFGLDIPTLSEVSVYALDEDLTPSTIQSQYIQLPPSINEYITAHPYFQSHYNSLNATILGSDNAVEVAQKIQTYLTANFAFGTNAMDNDPPEDTEDTVEWFCEHEEGIWSDFASAFSVFCRAFGVASRFVNGYNSRFLEETYDPVEGKNVIPIKYRNIYNWAEIYVPTAITGAGEWVQVDVCENIDPILNGTGGSGAFNITVSSNFTDGDRFSGTVANITAKLTSQNTTVDNRLIEFYDYSMDESLGQAYTDQNGSASILVDINASQTIGHHIITASYSTAVNFTTYMITGGSINLSLTNLSPSIVNVSNDPTALIEGTLNDPINGKPVRFALVNFLLFQKGTNNIVPLAFEPVFANTSDTGTFSELLTFNSSLPIGEYEIRADFNGTWLFSGSSYPSINDSSNRLPINITKEITYDLHFYINNVEASDNNAPVVRRGNQIELKAIVLNSTGGTIAGEYVGFYDFNNNFIGGSISNALGEAVYTYSVDNTIPGGPNKVYARLGTSQNSSYYILNANISLNMNTFPNPNSVRMNSGLGDTFIISGYLYDEFSNPIRYGSVNIEMLDGAIDVAPLYLVYESGSYISQQNGYIYLEFSVSDTTPTQNFTIQVSFNGNFYYPSPEPTFNLGVYSNFTSTQQGNYELNVYDQYDITILFSIDDTPTQAAYNNANPPNTYESSDSLTLQVDIFNSSGPAEFYMVSFTDVDQNNQEIANYTFNGTEVPAGHYNTTLSLSGWNAGIHQIRVTWGSFGVYNSTYIIINETVDVNSVLSTPALAEIQRNQDGFTVSGSIQDNSEGLRGMQVSIHLLDIANNDVSGSLNYATGYSQYMLVNNDGTFEFVIDQVDDSLQGKYKIRIDFNGTLSATGLSLNNYMESKSSDIIYLNITARTSISGYYYTIGYPSGWYTYDTCIVEGTLSWDNGTTVSNAIINVTVKNGTGTILNSKTNTTDINGDFYVSFTVQPTWDDDTEIWVYFESEDEFTSPFVYYVEDSQQQVYRL